MNRNAGAYKTHEKPTAERLWKQHCTPSFTMETYDKHGRLQKIELLRTLSYEEFQFELERARLPLASVTIETGIKPNGDMTIEEWV